MNKLFHKSLEILAKSASGEFKINCDKSINNYRSVIVQTPSKDEEHIGNSAWLNQAVYEEAFVQVFMRTIAIVQAVSPLLRTKEQCLFF